MVIEYCDLTQVPEIVRNSSIYQFIIKNSSATTHGSHQIFSGFAKGYGSYPAFQSDSWFLLATVPPLPW